jgi:BAG domain
LQIQAGAAPTDAKEPITSEETWSVIKAQGNTLAVIEAATVGVARSESEKRALVLQNTTSLVEQLLDEWTLLAQKQEIDQPSDEWGSHRKAAKTGGLDETTGGPQSPSSERASTRYVTRGGENLSVDIGRSTSVRKSSVEPSHREDTPTRNHNFPQQPEDSNGRFQRVKVAADESRSPKPLRKPAYASQQSTLDANQTSYAPKGYQGLEDGSGDDSNDDDFSVVSQYEGTYGSRKSKFQDGTPFSIVLKRRSESTEQREVDCLRTVLNNLVYPYHTVGPSTREHLMLTEEIMTQVILKADELQLSEPEARLNRKELIDQAEGHLSQLNPRKSKNLRQQGPTTREGLR